jgi:hypothetical protein
MAVLPCCDNGNDTQSKCFVAIINILFDDIADTHPSDSFSSYMRLEPAGLLVSRWRFRFWSTPLVAGQKSACDLMCSV